MVLNTARSEVSGSVGPRAESCLSISDFTTILLALATMPSLTIVLIICSEKLHTYPMCSSRIARISTESSVAGTLEFLTG